MKEVIEEILQEEKEARERVDKAREKAKHIRLGAEEQAKEIVAKAQEQAQAASKKLLETARIDAEKEKNQTLEKAVQSSKDLWNDKNVQITQSVDKMFKLIINRRDSEK